MVGSGRRARAWWWRSALAALAGIATLECSSSEPPCQQAVLDRAWALAAEQCELAYRQSRHHDDGIALANALTKLNDHAAAADIARDLMGTPVRGSAHRMIGEAAYRRRSVLEAAAHTTAALAIHIAAGDDAEIMRDAHVLSMLWKKEGWYDAALEAAGMCRDAATRAGDRRALGYCELARADAYRMLGDPRAAATAMEGMIAAVEAPCDRAWAHLKLGLVQLQLQAPATAMARLAFEQAMTLARTCDRDSVSPAAHANLAWVSRATGEPADAVAHLDAIEGDHFEKRILFALLAADRGDLAAADVHLAATAALPAPDAQWTWYAAHLQAQVAEERGDEVAAMAGYQRAIDLASALLARTTENAPYVVATLRASYEALFAMHARAGWWTDALLVIAQLDMDDLLRSAAAAGSFGAGGITAPTGVAPGAHATVHPIAERTYSAESILAAWRDRDLVIAVAPAPRWIGRARERLWQLRVQGGRVSGAAVADADEANELARTLAGTPLDRDAATRLGGLLIPDVAPSSHALDVLLVGELGALPIAALRHGDALVMARRPLVRVLGLVPRAPPGRRSGAVVLGDPRRDLPRAAAEAVRAAQRLGTAAHLHEAATAERLASARSADVLHVAAHVHRYARDFALHLADALVRPADIVSAGIAPRLAVLASCGSAAARDQGGWGSIAAAFLRAGTDLVAATQWSVGDDAAAAIVDRFYAEGGADAPARALAAAQVAIAAASTSPDWAAFTVLASPPDASALHLSTKDRAMTTKFFTFTYAAVTDPNKASELVKKNGFRVWVPTPAGGWRAATTALTQKDIPAGRFALVGTFGKIDAGAGVELIVSTDLKDPDPPTPLWSSTLTVAQMRAHIPSFVPRSNPAIQVAPTDDSTEPTK
jgi:tetratricopeptide (TPR) repeat protein